MQIFDQPLNFLFTPTLENYRAVLEEDSSTATSATACSWASSPPSSRWCWAAWRPTAWRASASSGRNTIAYTTLLLRTVPLAVLAIPVFMIWSEWQLINSLWGLVLLYVAVNLPFTIWLLYGFVLQVPLELEEAAAIDGCGPLRVFTRVLLPLMAPGLAAAADLHLPHRLERVHPGPGADRPARPARCRWRRRCSSPTSAWTGASHGAWAA